MKRIFYIAIILLVSTTLVTIVLTFNQVSREETRLEDDIRYRSSLLADGLRESVEPNFINKSDTYLQTLVERYANNQRIAGLAVVDNTGNIAAVSSSLPKQISEPQQIATDAMDADKAGGDFVNFNGKKMYVFASPLHDKKSVVGALLVVQKASYIDNRLRDIWANNILRFLVQVLLISLAVLLILKWIIYEPIQRLVNSLQTTRLNDSSSDIPRTSRNPLFRPLLREVFRIQQSLNKARLIANEEARIGLEKLDSPWTEQRLKVFVSNTLKDRAIFMASNREPYIHVKNGRSIKYFIPASGMVTAIEPIMQACGGLWIAQGSGNADKLTVDKNDKIKVPPDEPKYTLKRIWLTEEEEKGYYYGFSNEGLWPLCHIAYTRPIFRKEDWEEYEKVNYKFAQNILSEIKGYDRPIVLIQDFQLALVPGIIKKERPDASVGIFWHIPWPNPESFSVCPWKKEIISGMLGADLIGFQTQQHCNNFVETVSRETESLLDLEQLIITKNNHSSYVKAFPISIAFPDGPKSKTDITESKKFFQSLNIKTKFIGLGVDRMDYTKGILERLKAIEIFLSKNPKYIGNFTFLQIAAPSREKIKEYQKFAQDVEQEVERVNNLFKKNGWKPIILSKRQHTHEEINQSYGSANFCLVTSLHDGMNLVSKEFVAARNDNKGVLILSQFTGAARELKDALIVNPYNGEQTADTIKKALELSPAEQTRRMKKMRDVVKNYNIYRWSAELLKAISNI